MDDTPTAFTDDKRKLRLRVASFSTSTMFASALESALQDAAAGASVSVADFGAVIAELLSPQGEAVDALMVLLDENGLPRRDWRESVDAARASYTAWVDMVIAAMEQFVRRGGAHLIVNTVPAPALPAVGHLDAVHADGLSRRVDEFNRGLRTLAANHRNVQVIETDAVLAGLAPAKRWDPKLWYYGRIPFSSAADASLAKAFTDAFRERGRSRPKVLALDLDDTLWRGLYGEKGALGVECGDDFPGNAFKALQDECLRLKSQGMLLTILSKNDPSAIEVFDKHPGMLLRRSDFVATRINWSPKADNVREIAAELDLGLDAFLFLDDSPHEREAMRQLAGAVRVLDLPADPAARPAALRSCWQTWPVRLTAEDSQRTEMYSARRGAEAAKASATNIEEYLNSLQQKLVVEAVSDRAAARIVQMHERTNQFNLTTRRLSEAELSGFLAQPDAYLVLQGRMSDRFGDHGVIICATAHITGARARLLTYLMSCRVIGRKVEFAFLWALIEALRARGVTCVEAEFIPTERNAPAADFLKDAGLLRAADGKLWLWQEGQCQIARPACVDIRA